MSAMSCLSSVTAFATFQQGSSTAARVDSRFNAACHFGSELSPQVIHREGEREGERIKECSDLGQRGIADQMWEAHPSLACKHTPLSRYILTLCVRMCVFFNRRTVQLFGSQSNSWHRSVLYLFLYPFPTNFPICSL